MNIAQKEIEPVSKGIHVSKRFYYRIGDKTYVDDTQIKSVTNIIEYE